MTEEEYNTMLSSTDSIRAYLYRVNDAETNEGQRITSTSKSITNLPKYEDLNSVVLDNKQ